MLKEEENKWYSFDIELASIDDGLKISLVSNFCLVGINKKISFTKTKKKFTEEGSALNP